MNFGKIQSIVFEEFFKEKVTNAHTWLSLYKSIINRVIKEIHNHKFIYQNFDVVCILAMRLQRAPIQLLSNLTKVISLGLI